MRPSRFQQPVRCLRGNRSTFRHLKKQNNCRPDRQARLFVPELVQSRYRFSSCFAFRCHFISTRVSLGRLSALHLSARMGDGRLSPAGRMRTIDGAKQTNGMRGIITQRRRKWSVKQRSVQQRPNSSFLVFCRHTISSNHYVCHSSFLPDLGVSSSKSESYYVMI